MSKADSSQKGIAKLFDRSPLASSHDSIRNQNFALAKNEIEEYMQTFGVEMGFHRLRTIRKAGSDEVIRYVRWTVE